MTQWYDSPRTDVRGFGPIRLIGLAVTAELIEICILLRCSSECIWWRSSTKPSSRRQVRERLARELALPMWWATRRTRQNVGPTLLPIVGWQRCNNAEYPTHHPCPPPPKERGSDGLLPQPQLGNLVAKLTRPCRPNSTVPSGGADTEMQLSAAQPAGCTNSSGSCSSGPRRGASRTGLHLRLGAFGNTVFR